VATFHSSIHEFVDGLLHSRKVTRLIVGKVVDYYDSVDSVWVSSKFTRDVLVPSVVLEKTTAADVITDSRNGFVTEERVDAYAEKIAFLLTHPEEAQRAGRGAFRTLYTPWDAVMEKVARLSTGIVSSSIT
jgi:hypothetical protein